MYKKVNDIYVGDIMVLVVEFVTRTSAMPSG